jgi:hypothetical protein
VRSVVRIYLGPPNHVRRMKAEGRTNESDFYLLPSDL